MAYPKFKYHPDKEAVLVQSEAHEKALGEGWRESPAEFGVETAPGLVPDPVIAAKKPKAKADPAEAPVSSEESVGVKSEAPKKAKRPKAKEVA